MSDDVLSREEKDYILDFVRAYNSAQRYNNSPATLNKSLKDMNMNPKATDRDTVESMIADPKSYEKNLRQLAQYVMNTIMPIQRLKKYFATILTFDYTIIPMVETNVMKTTAFKKAESRVYDFLDSLNPKKVFRRLLDGALTEDAKYYYLRESDEGITLQEMPSDYCMITYEDEYSYRYAFNMNYFLKAGVDLEGFAPEFKQYYNEMFFDINKVNKYMPNWIELDPEKAYVFKFDISKAGLTPPLLGLFVDSIEIDTYRNFKESKTALEVYKLVIGSIPRHKDNKSGNKKNDFALSSKMAGEFSSLLKASLPEGVDFKATPFEDVKTFEFGQNANQSDVANTALQNLINSSGSSQNLSLDKPTQSTVKAGQKIDEAYVNHMYFQAEDFINYQLKKVSSKYIFRIKLEGTIFDTEDRKKNAIDLASLGIVTDKLGASMGLNPREFDKLIDYMQARGYPEKLKPIVSGYQLNGDSETKPEKSDNELTDSAEKTRDHDLNDE